MGTVPIARPLPIAFAIQSFHPGGTERQMIELVRRLDPTSWQVHVACFSTDGAWFPQVESAAASIGAFPLRGFARTDTLRQARRFGAWCRERSITLVHTSDLYTNIFFLPSAAAAGVPVRLGSRREFAAGKSRAQVVVQRASYACAHRVVANAHAVAERLVRERLAADRIAVVPNGLDGSRFIARDLPPALRQVAMVANLRPGKGQDVLIDAAPAILQRYPDARFTLIGGGTERPVLEARARERGVAHAFQLEGHVEDVARRLGEADLCVLPSDSEAFPNALLEAMAAGLPVVASRVGGVLEVVQHERTGLLVPPRDPHALATEMLRLMSDPQLARGIAAAGREFVLRRFSFDRMVSAFEHLYLDEVARRVPVRPVESRYAPL